MMGRRVMTRVGHHDASVDITTPIAAHRRISDHGTSKVSMRWFAADSTAGDANTQPTTPSTVPTRAATTPTNAPLASITSRSWRVSAPVAASRPSWRWRRCATTTKPAAAINATSIIASVTPTITMASAAAFSSPCPMTVSETLSSADPTGPLGRVKLNNSVTRSGVVATGITPKLSSSLCGFSTRPTTRRGTWPSVTSSPTPTDSSAATSLVKETSLAAEG